jgi:hypothetical protein
MYGQELELKILDDRLELVRALIARYEPSYSLAPLEHLRKDVHLIEHQHKRRMLQELVPAYVRPQHEAVLEPVHGRIFLEERVEDERDEEDDGTGVIEVGDPSGAAASGPVDVVDVPILMAWIEQVESVHVIMFGQTV